MRAGVFLNTNGYSALKVREIVCGLSPVACLTDIPDGVTVEQLIDAIRANGVGWNDFSGKYGSFTLLFEEDWVHVKPRFNYNFSYETIMRGVKEYDTEYVA